ncbi:MAG: hypothetical protein LLG06_03330 [Desulfobacteraceae bacterium]|nr:hypothetical protein [Desulfobacteraceae bacterium]
MPKKRRVRVERTGKIESRLRWFLRFQLNRGVMTMDPVDRIDQVFLQLVFAIKLLNYFELKKVSKKEFDASTYILKPNLHFPEDTFHTYDDLIHDATNTYLL